MTDILEDYPIIYYKNFDVLIYNVIKYSRNIKDIIRLDPDIVDYNKSINWTALVGIGDKLAHKYVGLKVHLIFANIKEFFIPFINNLFLLKLPDYLYLPKFMEQFPTISIDDKYLEDRSVEKK